MVLIQRPLTMMPVLVPCTWDVEEVLEFSMLPAISGFLDRHGFYSADVDGDVDR